MNAATAPRLDALIIGGDVPDEFLGRHVRERNQHPDKPRDVRIAVLS